MSEQNLNQDINNSQTTNNTSDPFYKTQDVSPVADIAGSDISISGIQNNLVASDVTDGLNIDQLLAEIKQNTSDSAIVISPDISNIPSTSIISSGITPKKVVILGGSLIGFVILIGIGFWVWSMMYPIESQQLLDNMFADTQQVVVNDDIADLSTGGSGVSTAISSGVVVTDTGISASVDDLFAGITKTPNTGSVVTGISSNNIDGSDGLIGDISDISSNPDQTEQAQYINNIRAKIELAKISYQSAQDIENTKAAKIIAVSIKKFEQLLSDVENNQITINNDIADRISDIQSLVDQAKIMMGTL